MKKRKTANTGGFAALGLIGLLTVNSAQADAVCDKGYRDTTDAERETMTAVLEGARDALPEAPAGWIIRDDGLVSVPTAICMDAALWTYEFTRYYQRIDDQQAQEALLQASADAMKADMQAKQPRLDAIMARNMELSTQAAAAAEAGDYARVDAINQDIEAGVQEYQGILDEGGTQAQVQADLEEADRDRQMSVSARINPYGESDDGGEAIAVPAGASAAYLWRTENNLKQANALVLLGQWEPAPDYGLRHVPRAGAAPEAAHAISVHIEADASRLPAALDSTDFNRLAALLGD